MDADTPKFKTTTGSCKYAPDLNAVVWTIKSFPVNWLLFLCLLPCPAGMPGQGSVPSTSIFSCLGRLPPPNRTCFMPDVVHSPHSWSSFCPHTSHFHLHRLLHLISFIRPQNGSILVQPGLPSCQCDFFHSQFYRFWLCPLVPHPWSSTTFSFLLFLETPPPSFLVPIFLPHTSCDESYHLFSIAFDYFFKQCLSIAPPCHANALEVIIIIIIIQHFILRHIHVSGHCGHSEAHYKHLHIINNIMIKMHYKKAR